MVPLNPYVLSLMITLAGGYYVGDQTVKGIKKVDVKVVHVLKHVGHALKIK